MITMKVLYCTFLILITFQALGQTDKILIRVHANGNEYINVPIYVPLEKLPVQPWDNTALFQIENNSERQIPFQIEMGRHLRLVFMMSGYTNKNEVKEFVYRSVEDNISYSSVEIVSNDESFTMIRGEKKVLSYQYREKIPPDGVDAIYRRSAFIHPLWSPSQAVLSRIQPEDHYHHYGIWNPWTKTKYQGEEIDFWNLGEKQGTVRFQGLIAKVSGPVYGEINVLQDHVKLSDSREDKTILHENWIVRTWKQDNYKNIWMIDFTSILNCASGSPLELMAYRYGGGIGFRAAEYWTGENTTVLTSEGKTRNEADGSRARWCRVSAKTSKGSHESGILFMSHPLNRDHPEPMRVWPSDANEGRGDLFFEFCPIRHNSWMLLPGKEYALNYRLLVFDDPISPDQAELYWKSFVNSPEVEIIVQ
jgi:hypothetical protein